MAQIYPTASFEIDATRATHIADHSAQSARVSPRSESDVRSGDIVQLSGESSSVGRLAASAAAGASVRSDRVEALRNLVESGRFNPEPRAIADAILREERGMGRS